MAKNIVWTLLTLSFPMVAHAQVAPATRVDYDKDVKPLLAQHCYACHGDEVQQAGLRLDRRQPALRGGDYGPVIVPGKSGDSKLIRRLVDGDGGLQMPPSGALAAEDINTLRAWIDQGAEFRNDVPDDAPPRPLDPKIAGLVTAVRSKSRATVERLIGDDFALIQLRDAAGSTLLHHAAGFGALDMMALLLDRGADVNAKNRRGSTPLHWAVHDQAKVRLLLSRGATVNSKQNEGRTPLFLAASLANSIDTIRLLLAKGADPDIATANRQTPLMAAAALGSVDAVRLLLDADAAVDAKNGAGETALMLAAGDGNPDAVALLLARGADARVRSKRNETALGNAATAGVEHTVRLLVEAGADVNVRNIRGYSPLMLAASSDTIPAGVVKLLLQKGADTTYTGDYDETARDLAAKRGDTEVTRLLGGAAEQKMQREADPAPSPVPAHADVNDRRSIRDAVSRALTLVEKQSHTFIRIGGCNSCHSQDLPSAAAAFARSRGHDAPRDIPQLPASMMPTPERLMDLNFVAVTGVAWELFDFGMNRVPRSAYTDAAVRLIQATQTAAGNWPTNESRRPPMSAGDYQAAALAIFGLKHYGVPGDEAATEQAIARAATWLERARPENTQDRAFQALALKWAGRGAAAREAARSLIALQRSDGGWSQLPGLGSDAYATGQALFALSVAEKLQPADAPFQRGVEYLLRTQAADGSWHVKSRSIWLQPYFESGFPYGQDQFISTAGTAWAAMALTTAAGPEAATETRRLARLPK